MTPTSIKVVGIAGLTSPTGGYPGADVGAAAYFAKVNKDGGVNGRKIDYIGTEDDNENPATNLNLMHKAVQDDQVFAVVPQLGTGFEPPSSDYLNSQQVPSVGWGFLPGQCAGPQTYGFGFNGCGEPPGNATIDLGEAGPIMKIAGKGASVAVMGDNASSSIVGEQGQAASFRAAGANVVYSGGVIPETANVDYAPYVQTLLTSDKGKPPQVILLSCEFNNVVGMSAALHQAGYKGYVLNFLGYSPGLLSSSKSLAQALNGDYINVEFTPPEEGGSGVEQMKQDIQAYKPGAQLTLGAIITYWSASVFVQMLQAAGQDLTPARFGQVINGGWTYKPPGSPPVIGPVSYPQDHSQPTSCWALVQAQSSAYKPIFSLECYGVKPLKEIPQ